MKKLKIIITLFTIVLIATQCSKAPNSDFLITNNSFGKLKKEHSVKDIETLFANDSIVVDTTIQLTASKHKRHIFEQGGKPLFTVSINSDDEIENIQVLDSRYTTNEGIGLLSTFKEIKDNYTIEKVITSMNNVILFIKDSDLYFTLNREELPANLRYDINAKIEAVQIPDAAKIKYMMLGWD